MDRKFALTRHDGAPPRDTDLPPVDGRRNPGAVAYRAMYARLVDATAPALLALARLAREGGPLAAPDGTVARHVSTPDGWTLGVVLDGPGGGPDLFAVRLRPPLSASPTLRARIAETVRTFERADREIGVDDPDDPRRAFASAMLAEARVAEECAREGYPDDLPPPDAYAETASVACVRCSDDATGPEWGEGLGALAARTRHSRGLSPDSALAVLARDSLPAGTLFSLSPSSVSDGRRRPGPGTVRAGADFVLPMARLDSMLDAAGLRGEVATAFARQATERHAAYASGPDADALERFGVALAMSGQGIPGPRAAAAAAGFEAVAAAHRLADREGDLATLADFLEAAGHDGPGNAFAHDDLDALAWAFTTTGGQRAVVLDGDDGRFVAVTGGQGATLAAARFGAPLDEFTRRHGKAAAGRAGIDDALHDDHANPADPGAPLDLARAVEALDAGASGFPGFLGRFTRVPGGLEPVDPAPLSQSSVAGTLALAARLESAARACELGASPNP